MFIEAMKSISKKGYEDPESFHKAPRLPKVSRPDEAQAARQPKLKWTRQPVWILLFSFMMLVPQRDDSETN